MKTKHGKKIVSLLLASAIALPVFSGVLTGCSDGGTEESGTAFYSLDQVVITDDYAVNGLDKEVDYLLKLDADKLLYWFYKNAGLTPTSTACYGGGWESSLIGGHTMGHYLSALAQAYANAGTGEADKAQLLERIEYLIEALNTCQQNSQGEAGFLWGAYYSASTFGENVEFQFDNVEKGLSNISTQAWVPWYTMHKILQGVIDVYIYTGSETAYSIATGLGDWVYNRVSQWDPATQATVLSIEYGGMNDCLYTLYSITGEDRYAIAAHMFDEESLYATILQGDSNYLDGLHANTTIPKIIGALNRYITCDGKEIDGEVVDAAEMLQVAELFWERVVNDHTYITGGNSEWEHFGLDDVLDSERTNCNCETCNTYNMLKLSRTLFLLTGDVKYLDYYENTYYNAIWSSQNPETGMTTYFQPMATGYFKVYSTEETNFWCCTGSGMESFTKLNDSIYYQAEDGVYIAMYLDSALETDQLKITQSADLENSDVATFSVEKGSTKLYFRIPEWTNSFSVTVNGEAAAGEESNGFYVLSAKKGDQITVTLEKTVTAYNLPDGQNAYAFKYGPFVLSAQLGTVNMTMGKTGVSVTIPSAKDYGAAGSEYIHVTEGTVADFIANIGAYMVNNGDGTFTLTGTDTQLTYSYHFRQYQQRYGLYFYFTGTDVESDEVSAPYTWTTVDTVQPGYGQYEKGMEDDDSVGSTSDAVAGTSRYAKAGGSFTYYLSVEEGKENYLILYLCQEDNGKTLEIVSGETVLYSATLAYTGTASVYEVQIPIPSSVVETASDHTVTVNAEQETLENVIPITFRSADGSDSARVASFVYTKTFENHQAYFVDCGDYDVTTVTQGDCFGLYNSVTEQVYGADPVTGKYWGIVDTNDATWSGSAPQGVSTNSTWAYEYNSGDGLDKTASSRYTKNQYESGISRSIQYQFQLEDGTYRVIVYFTDPWNVSANPSVSANGVQMIADGSTNKALEFEVTVSGGALTLDFTSDSACINLAYIMILFAE